VLAELEEKGVRAELDERGMSLNAKIRESQLQKIPYTLVVGDRDVEKRRGDGAPLRQDATRNRSQLRPFSSESEKSRNSPRLHSAFDKRPNNGYW